MARRSDRIYRAELHAVTRSRPLSVGRSASVGRGAVFVVLGVCRDGQECGRRHGRQAADASRRCASRRRSPAAGGPGRGRPLGWTPPPSRTKDGPELTGVLEPHLRHRNSDEFTRPRTALFAAADKVTATIAAMINVQIRPFLWCSALVRTWRAPWKAALSSGCKSHPATAPAGSSRSSYGGDEIAEAFGMRVTNW